MLTHKTAPEFLLHKCNKWFILQALIIVMHRYQYLVLNKLV